MPRMQIVRHRIELASAAPIEIVDITDRVKDFVARSGVRDGLLTVSCLHTTARVNINEREPQLQRDMLAFLQRLAPRDGDYLHNVDPVDGRDNAHSHLLGLLMNSSESVPVVAGELLLGGWQAVFFIELDGPRKKRAIELQVMGNA
jgi:secondary thiamine-phosphate synthase enzyme